MNQSLITSNTQIKFNKNLYTTEAINEATKAFQKFFKSNIIQKEENILVELETQKEDPIIIKEFCNYVLGSMQNIRRESQDGKTPVQ